MSIVLLYGSNYLSKPENRYFEGLETAERNADWDFQTQFMDT